MANSISLQLPDRLYQRLVNTAQATQQPLEAIILRALEVGSPPDWEDIPEPFQADIAALDRFMLRKAQATALLRWRGHSVPHA